VVGLDLAARGDVREIELLRDNTEPRKDVSTLAATGI
jgi:hypothetical protein